MSRARKGALNRTFDVTPVPGRAGTASEELSITRTSTTSGLSTKSRPTLALRSLTTCRVNGSVDRNEAFSLGGAGTDRLHRLWLRRPPRRFAGRPGVLHPRTRHPKCSIPFRVPRAPPPPPAPPPDLPRP